MTDNILDKMTYYVNHRNESNSNNNSNNDIFNTIRDNLVKRRQLNAKIYAHNMAVRARKHNPKREHIQSNTIETSEPNIFENSEPETIEPIQPNTIENSEPEIIETTQKQPNSTNRRRSIVIIDKSVITNNIVF